jgi:hypothetical protein
MCQKTISYIFFFISLSLSSSKIYNIVHLRRVSKKKIEKKYFQLLFMLSQAGNILLRSFIIMFVDDAGVSKEFFFRGVTISSHFTLKIKIYEIHLKYVN